MTRASTVYLIGAGPGDPGLITVRGLQCLTSADVVLYDHLVHARLLRHARRGRREDRRRRRRTAAARAGGDLLSARGKSPRRKDRGAAQMGRSVRVRSRWCGSAVPARAGRALRGDPRRAGRYRGAELRWCAHHLSRRRGHADVRARPRRRRQGAYFDRLGEPREARRHHRLLRRPAAGADGPACAAHTRQAAGRFGRGDLRWDAADAGNPRGNAGRAGRGDAGVERPASGGAGRRARRRAPRASTMV